MPRPDPAVSTPVNPIAASGSNWPMLLVLSTAFALSQAFRTVAAMMAGQLQHEFALSPQQLGLFAGAFHFAFGALQLLMGIGIDMQGVRRTVLWAFPFAIAGAVLSALAPTFAVLVVAQVLIGIGCAPAFLVCTVFIARRFPARRFAPVSGLVLGLGGLGMLLTGTPLAWLVHAHSWRAGFAALAAAALLSWLLIFFKVRDEPAAGAGAPPSLRAALRGFGVLFTTRHTAGIVALGAVTYASFISLRGLWLGPLLVERHALTLLQSGHVALAMSIVALFGSPLFGWLDPGAATRRRWIVGCTLLLAFVFGTLAVSHTTALAIGAALLAGLVSGYIVLQYADVRIAYPAALTGRAMAVFTMAMFLGVALMQWFTGVVASIATERHADPFVAAFGAISVLLLGGVLAFSTLPQPAPDASRAAG